MIRDRLIVSGIFAFCLCTVVTAAAGAVDGKSFSADVPDAAAGDLKNSVLQPQVNEKYEYYEVCGGCEKDVQGDLKKKCIAWTDGKKYDSVTNWKVKWNYDYNRRPGTCTTGSFRVTVDVVFHVPKWVRTADASRSLEKKWTDYVEKLMLHEKGHRDQAVQAADDLTRAVAELPPTRSCEELDRAVHSLSKSRMDALLKAQDSYDAATSHGAAQGAVFP